MRTHRAPHSLRSVPLGCDATVALCILCGALVVVPFWACSGSGQNTSRSDQDQVVIETDRAYLRLPSQMLETQLELEQVGNQLVRCYERQASTGAWDITYVNLELVLLGNQFQARVGQGRTNLSESFASCIDRATMGWSFDPDFNHDGDVIPLEFGPTEEEPTP